MGTTSFKIAPVFLKNAAQAAMLPVWAYAQSIYIH